MITRTILIGVAVILTYMAITNYAQSSWEAKPLDEKLEHLELMRLKDVHCQNESEYARKCNWYYQQRAVELIEQHNAKNQ